MERLNREKKIDHSKIRVKICTTNNENPKAIYLEIGFFVSPRFEEKSYNSDIIYVKRDINRHIRDFISDSCLFDQRFITSFELSMNGLKAGKRSYTSLQVTMRQSSDQPKSLKEIHKLSDQHVRNLCSNIADSFEERDFDVYKNKT